MAREIAQWALAMIFAGLAVFVWFAIVSVVVVAIQDKERGND